MVPADARAQIQKVYKGASWAEKVSKMSDEQVTAIYIKFKNQGKLKG